MLNALIEFENNFSGARIHKYNIPQCVIKYSTVQADINK